MKAIKRLFLIVVFLVIFPSVVTIALLKFTATPLTNYLLKEKINAPAKVEKVDFNWFLTKLYIQNLEIENPPTFPKGDLLKITTFTVDINPKTYLVFKPILTLYGKNIYLHYIRNSSNATNIAVAFNLPYKKARVNPLEFEVKDFDISVNVNTLSNVIYRGSGKFVGFHNNSDFSFNGTADLSNMDKPISVTDFVVYNWRIRNNKYFNKLAEILNNPSLKDITLTKIEGRVKLNGELITFVDRNTKAYTVGDVLFAEIYKGSEYNRLTKKLNIKLALYLPMKVIVRITGTTEKPIIEVENLKDILRKVGPIIGNPKNSTNLAEPIKKVPEKVKKVLEKPIKEFQEEINKVLKGLIGN